MGGHSHTERTDVDVASAPDTGRDGAPEYDVVVLAGGSARRFGGTDKVLLPVAGTPMLERVLAAAAGARTVVVVGPEREVSGSLPSSLRWTRERPAGAGPLAALAAGLDLCTAPVVVVLAGDMPLLDAHVVARLLEVGCQGDVDGAVLVDAGGRTQPLAAAYQQSAVRRALAAIGDPRNQPMRLLLARLNVARVPEPRAALDCDTPEELVHANEVAADT
ncbi:molybdenum cofactor guanylyltransferase [Actinopolymorpha alba]|uniref:molybdenum cofactor guanylyltransferase n=1 Tax=Actinopolymorpha alba TaxID=533267 RepID=UPI0003805744|nr:NTP transferase domain-containing protein [Actinopolymorpha alba]